MRADPVFDRELGTLVRSVLDAESGPDPSWADAPAARRVTAPARTRRWRWPLRALAVAAVLVIGASVAALIAGGPPDPAAPVRLAYGIDGDVYVADADGADPVMIADGHSDAGCGPSRLVSPDGRHLAYRSYWERACTRAYTIIDPDGHVISTIPSDGWRVSWSPDGTRFATWLAFGQTVSIYGVDGVLLAVLDGSQACCGDQDPVWSPDGAESVLLPIRYPSPDQQAVLELPVDGGTPHPVPADDPRSQTYALGWQPMVYSPDGAHAAFADHSRVSGLLVMVAADGTQRRELAKGDVQEGPTWSPTGDRIAFVVSLPTRVELRVVDVVSGAETTLAGVPRPGSMRTFGFAPDGGRVLFGQTGADASPSIWIADSDGSGVRLLAEGAPDVDADLVHAAPASGLSGGWLSVSSDAEPP